MAIWQFRPGSLTASSGIATFLLCGGLCADTSPRGGLCAGAPRGDLCAETPARRPTHARRHPRAEAFARRHPRAGAFAQRPHCAETPSGSTPARRPLRGDRPRAEVFARTPLRGDPRAETPPRGGLCAEAPPRGGLSAEAPARRILRGNPRAEAAGEDCGRRSSEAGGALAPHAERLVCICVYLYICTFV